MSKRNDDFFKEKKEWSILKDELFGCYFSPYISKVIHTYKPITFIDCFAGKGMFDDGEPGSPIIALNIISDCISKSKLEQSQISIHSYFIELNHADILTENLHGYSNISIIDGDYVNEVMPIINSNQNSNVFLYLDPYGINSLDFSLYIEFLKCGLNTVELLINFNSFGFFREACRIYGVEYNDENGLLGDLIEYDPSPVDSISLSCDIDRIAGGNYWKKIINEYKNGKYDGYEAENLIVKGYCNELKKYYKYVLNMPIRLKQGQRPKYRMIHATNHEEGCLLMIENMGKRQEAMKYLQRGVQSTLFDEDVENNIIDLEQVENNVVNALKQNCTVDTALNEFLCNFFVEHGLICNKKDVIDILKKLEKSKKITVKRDPASTKDGKPKTSYTQDRKQYVGIRWGGNDECR